MTSDVLNALLRANLAGAVAILAVIALRKPFRKLAGAQVAYGFWLAVPLVAAASLLPARELAPLVITAARSTTPDAFEAVSSLEVRMALFVLWITGAGLGISHVLWRHAMFVHALGRMRRRDDGVMQAEVSRLGPAVIGVIRPTIVLPGDFEARFDPMERVLIIAHEARHVRAGHVHLNAAMVLLQCLNWFNPLVHLAAHFIRIDQELACDEAVVAGQPNRRRVYAEAMLKTQLAETKLALGCYWPSRAKHPLVERIAMLKVVQPGAARRSTGAAALALLTAAGGVAAWAAQPSRQEIILAHPPVIAPAPAAIATPARVPPQAAALAARKPRPSPARKATMSTALAVETPAATPTPSPKPAYPPGTILCDGPAGAVRCLENGAASDRARQIEETMRLRPPPAGANGNIDVALHFVTREEAEARRAAQAASISASAAGDESPPPRDDAPP